MYILFSPSGVTHVRILSGGAPIKIPKDYAAEDLNRTSGETAKGSLKRWFEVRALLDARTHFVQRIPTNQQHQHRGRI
jgi:hypothetical protein